MSKLAAIGAAFWLVAGVASGQAPDAAEQHWPRWRGPLANGVAPHGDPPITWSEQENVKWKVSIPGQGSASPIIWGDQLFLLTAVPAGEPAASAAPSTDHEPVALLQPPRRGQPGRGGFQPPGRGRGGFGGGQRPMQPHDFVVLCLDRHTGETLWRKTARTEVPHEAGHQTNTFASASPVTDGKRLIASFGSRGIYCFDLAGNLIWEKDLGNMQTRGSFGEGASPALHGETLVVPWDHEGQSFVAALDATTGEEKWRVDRDEPSTWATPLVVPRGDSWQVVLNGTNRVRSYDLETGELLWECGGQAQNPIPTPVADDKRVYVMTGFRGFALYAIPLDAEGDLTNTDRIAWRRNEGTPYISSPVLSNGLLYFTKDRNAILSCVEAETGKEVYKDRRLPGMSTLYSSPVAAGGRLYIFSREGAAVVVKEGREFEILAENRLDEGVDASPAVLGETMYVRGERSLYCLAKP
jgi:outer membrane protein assembly factor BamB